MRPKASQGDRLSGETNGALYSTAIYVHATYIYISTCVRGWQGSGPDSAPAKSHSLSLSFFLSLHFSPIPLFPSFFSFFFSLSPSPSLSLSPSLFPRLQRVTLLLFRRYLDWLAFQRTTLFPATTEIPVAVSFPRVVSPTRKLLSRRTDIIISATRLRFRNLVSTNTWTIGVRRTLRSSYEEIVSRECGPDPGREGSIIFEREEGRTNGRIRQGRSESGCCRRNGRSLPETRTSRGGGGAARERGR